MNPRRALWLLFVLLPLATWVAARAAQQSDAPYRPRRPTASSAQPSTPTQVAPSPAPPATTALPAQATAAPKASPAPQTAQPSSQPKPVQPPAPSAGNFSPANPPQIYTVSIHNSPGVPDRGSNCIICGIVRGNFTAVEPNLAICVQATGLGGAANLCTDTCQQGHDCKIDFNAAVRLKYPSPSVHITVWNIDVDPLKAYPNSNGVPVEERNQAPIAEFDEPDATACTIASPCPVPNPAGGPPMTIGFDFGSIDCNNSPYALPSTAPSGLTLFAAPTQGMLPDPGQPTISPNQHNPWREYFCLLQPSQKGGWVVQQMQYENSTHPQPSVFWETFVIVPGAQHSGYPDTFEYDFGPHQDGFMAVNAQAIFYEGLPNDFIRTHFFLNMPHDNLDIIQPSYQALSTTDPSAAKQLNQMVMAGTVKASNTLYRAWNLQFKDGHIVP